MARIDTLTVCSLDGSGKALVLSGVLMAAILVLGAALLAVRRLYVKWLKRTQEKAFSVEELERMHGGGLISREEFARLRRVCLGLRAPAAENRQTQSRTTGNLDDGKNMDRGGQRSRDKENS